MNLSNHPGKETIILGLQELCPEQVVSRHEFWALLPVPRESNHGEGGAHKSNVKS